MQHSAGHIHYLTSGVPKQIQYCRYKKDRCHPHTQYSTQKTVRNSLQKFFPSQPMITHQIVYNQENYFLNEEKVINQAI